MGRLRKRFTLQVYNIGIVSGDVLEKGIQKNSIKWLKHNYKDRFFADPFLWYQDAEFYYILVEEMCFYLEYGRIVLLKVEKNDFKLIERKIIIEEPFHMSFPYCKVGGEYIIPEASMSGKCTQYKVSIDTHKVQEKIVLADDGIIDQIFMGNDKNRIMLGGRKNAPNSELYAYRLNEYGKYVLTSDNPICCGRYNSRNAGAIFEYKGSLIRPAQDCTARYGCGTVLMNVTNLDGDSYEQDEIMRLEGWGNPPYEETLHTFNYYDEFAILDGSIDVYSFRNYIYLARKLVRRILYKFLGR